MKLYTSWLKKGLYRIRESFWPLIDRPAKDEEDESEENDTAEIELVIEEANLEKAFSLNNKISEGEDSRRASVESKATSLISAIGISSSIVVAASTVTINSTENLSLIRISVAISFILTVYTLRTVWFAVKALERKSYHQTDFSDTNITGDKNEYYRKMIIKVAEMTKKNHSVINEKVNSMVMAQEYYKRAIVVIFIYAFFVLIYCFLLKTEKRNDDIRPKYNLLKQNL